MDWHFDIGSFTSWAQLGLWIISGIVWVLRWKTGGATVHPKVKKYLLSNKTLGACISIAIVLSVFNLLFQDSAQFKFHPHAKLIAVSNQTFENEIVELDD